METHEILKGVKAGKISVNDAKKLLEDAEEKDGLTLRIRTEKTNDKSGKATPMDRILIIAPSTAGPKPFQSASTLEWKPFHQHKSQSTLAEFDG